MSKEKKMFSISEVNDMMNAARDDEIRQAKPVCESLHKLQIEYDELFSEAETIRKERDNLRTTVATLMKEFNLKDENKPKDIMQAVNEMLRDSYERQVAKNRYFRAIDDIVESQKRG